MKINYSIIILAFLVIAGCGKKDEYKLEAFNPEAFAYDLGESWEVNALIHVKGFKQREDSQSGTFEASLDYSVDLITPEGGKISKIFTDSSNETNDEEFQDLQLEVQFELDSTYKLGKYKLIFDIKDNFSDNSTTSPVEFELTD